MVAEDENRSRPIVIEQWHSRRGHALTGINRDIYVQKLNILHYVLRTMTQQKRQIIKIVLLQSWHIFTRTRTIALFYT